MLDVVSHLPHGPPALPRLLAPLRHMPPEPSTCIVVVWSCRVPPMVAHVVHHTTKKDTSVTFWAERIFFFHTYDTSMTIIVTKPGIIIDVVGSYFYDKKS